MRREARRRRGLGLLGACLLALVACVPGRLPVATPGEVGADEVLVVGRIELLPALDAHEQELNAQHAQLRGKGHLLLGSQQRPLNRLGWSDYQDAVLVDLGRDFQVRQRRVPELHYSGTVIALRAWTRLTGPRSAELDHEELKLPGRIAIRLRPDDRAVYIGTLRYHRDAFNVVKQLEIVDDYARANREHRERFGALGPLRNAASAR